MRRMKLYLASLATGVLVVGFVIVMLAIVNVLFPGLPTWMFSMWIFGWPLLFLQLLPGPTTPNLFLSAFVLGTVLDVVVVSVVSFVIFNARRSKVEGSRVALPPPPAGF